MFGNVRKAPVAGITIAALALSALPLATLAQSAFVPSKATARQSAPIKTLAQSVPNAVARAKKLNRLASASTLSVYLCFKFADPQAAQDYTDAVNDPNSLLYGQWLTPQEIGERFGPDPAGYAAGLQYLKDKGLAVTDMPVHRMAIMVTGTAAQMEQAFGVQLNEYQEAAADAQARAVETADPTPIKFFAPATPVQLPAAIAAKVSAVVGLNNYARPVPHLRKRRDTILGGPFTPAQARAAYDLNPLYVTNNMKGQGRTVGISNFDGVDVTRNGPLFINANGLPTPAGGAVSNVSRVTVGTSTGTSGKAEGDLDLQMVLGMAPLANVIIYDSGNFDLYGVLSREFTDNLVDIVSESYGWGLGGDSQAYTDLHKMMSMAGITYLAASGDNGNVANTQYPYPDYEPDVLIIGGTLMQYNSTTGKYLSEVGWGGSGGGFTNNTSAANATPAYQAGRGVPTTSGQRMIPDISSVASGYSGGAYYFYYGGGNNGGYSGTSFASPVMAGQLAVIEQYLAAQSALPANSAGKQRLGRLNDRIYGFNGRNDIFHDVTSGNNGFGATPYWDYVTGWGSVDLYNLAVALKSPLTVTVTPATATLAPGQSVQFSGVGSGSVNTAFTWTIVSGPGTITSGGLYTAPATITTALPVTIKAASVLDTALPGNPRATFRPDLIGGTATVYLPVTRTISGTIALDGIPDPGATAVPINPFTFILKAGSNAPIIILQKPGAGGAFSLTGIPAATYNLTVKGDKWLRTKRVVIATSGDVTDLALTMRGGDSNDDNSVDATDFGALVGAYGSNTSVPGSGYDPTADFNNDGSVDTTDFGILVGSYGLTGASS